MHLIQSNEEVKAIIDIKLDMMLLFPEDKELLIAEIKELQAKTIGQKHDVVRKAAETYIRDCQVCGTEVEYEGISSIVTCDDDECIYTMQRSMG